jgi:hypothetical protein
LGLRVVGTARALDGGRGRLREAVEGALAIDWGCGALHVAAAHGRVPVCAYLVEDLQLNVDAVDIRGCLFSFMTC